MRDGVALDDGIWGTAMTPGRWRGTGPVLFTLAVVLLVAVAAAEGITFFIVIVVGVAALGVGFFYTVFPGSRVFAVALANSLAVYACIYVVTARTNFPDVDRIVFGVFFVLPLVAFLLGALRRREEIRAIIFEDKLPDERTFGRSARWLIPVFVITASTFLMPALELDETTMNVIFAVDMTVTSVLVYAASPGVSTFLIDTGVLFDDLLARIRQLTAPAFAFLTFYSLNVILFASLYQIIDSFTAAPMFLVDGALQKVTFTDSLYFSIISLSTVGYGDITPASDAIRVVVAVQVVFGILLLLFGFNEIFTYSRKRRGNADKKQD